MKQRVSSDMASLDREPSRWGMAPPDDRTRVAVAETALYTVLAMPCRPLHQLPRLLSVRQLTVSFPVKTAPVWKCCFAASTSKWACISALRMA
eukprot:3469411-Pyramimonas_sp.AAC.1